jgi:hypothetical protein
MNGEPGRRPPDESEQVPEAPNEGATGHNPDEESDDAVGRREDRESKESFPASDPPANY